MKDPGVLVDALVDKLRDIPALVTALGGNAASISAYHDQFPTANNLDRAVYEMKGAGVLIAWNGTGPGRAMQAWVHDIVMYMRSGNATDGDTLYATMVNGVPAHGDGLRLYQTTIDPSCVPMDLPRAVRQADEQGRDLFVIRTSLVEIGDN